MVPISKQSYTSNTEKLLIDFMVIAHDLDQNEKIINKVDKYKRKFEVRRGIDEHNKNKLLRKHLLDFWEV